MRTPVLAAYAMALALTVGASGATLYQATLFRMGVYRQTAPATVEPDITTVVGTGSSGSYLWAYEAYVNPGDFDGGELVYPGPNSPASLTAAGPFVLQYAEALPDLVALNAAAPFGIYSGTVTNSVLGTSTSAPDIIYSEDAWPGSIPMLTPATFAQLQNFDPTLPLSIAFNAFDTGAVANESYIFLEIFDFTANKSAFSQQYLSPALTSVFLPANTLEPEHLFRLFLMFSNSSASLSPTARTDVVFNLSTTISFDTAVPIVIPEPGTAAGMILALAGIVLLRRHRVTDGL